MVGKTSNGGGGLVEVKRLQKAMNDFRSTRKMCELVSCAAASSQTLRCFSATRWGWIDPHFPPGPVSFLTWQQLNQNVQSNIVLWVKRSWLCFKWIFNHWRSLILLLSPLHPSAELHSCSLSSGREREKKKSNCRAILFFFALLLSASGSLV